MSSCGDPIHCESAAEVKASIAVGPGTSLQALEFAEVRKEGNDCSNGRMKHEKEQGSESVNEEPRSHTCRTRRRTKCCGLEVSYQDDLAGLVGSILPDGAEQPAQAQSTCYRGNQAPGRYASTRNPGTHPATVTHLPDSEASEKQRSQESDCTIREFLGIHREVEKRTNPRRRSSQRPIRNHCSKTKTAR
jgi:hypothetical protein